MFICNLSQVICKKEILLLIGAILTICLFASTSGSHCLKLLENNDVQWTE